jgi:hypothetical protein
MDEVLGTLEEEIAALFVADNVVDCAVLEGGATGDRPDEYVSVVGMEAEYRAGNAYLVEMEFRSVVPLDDAGAAQRQKLRFRQMVDYINAPTSPLRTYNSPTLMIHGLVMRGLSSKNGERSRAEIARVRFGATATGASPGSISFVVS